MIRNMYNQAKCDAPCGSWHFSLQLDEHNNILEAKCCRCGAIHKVNNGMVTEIITQGKLKEIETKEKKAKK